MHFRPQIVAIHFCLTFGKSEALVDNGMLVNAENRPRDSTLANNVLAKSSGGVKTDKAVPLLPMPGGCVREQPCVIQQMIR